ncbi:MAG: FHA domain-containing protein [Paludibacteraceae bacterium]|nr:FHA domain-containing protein [Paludibacteraceae bacterium]
MEQYLRIKCPFCGKILTIKNQDGVEKCAVICPACKKKSQVASCQRVLLKNDEETDLNGKNKNEDSVTDFSVGNNKSIGGLVEKSGKRWPLHVGVNTIGRKPLDPALQSDIPIQDYTGLKKMSRHHAKIEVQILPNGSCKHILYNWENKNPTFVGNEKINNNDRIVLSNGMNLKFGDLEVRFVIEKKNCDETVKEYWENFKGTEDT